ncbi:nuclear transport factor 2 family protein [Hymenobacter bucti]|uniref:Nuclear transport factor 2 family protein n=1 Tax=Hymenobacter bucti TaxID=1844114 RepID=A0ABW4QXV7_9BACT
MSSTTQHQNLLRNMYVAFNARDIPSILQVMHPQVRWPRAWKGDYVDGHDAVRSYWLHQWQEVNPRVEPTGFTQRTDGSVEVAVHQLVKDMQGQVLFDGPVKHIYTIEDGLIKQMDIEQG